MLNALRKSIWSSKKKFGETLVPLFLDKGFSRNSVSDFIPGNTHGYHFSDKDSWEKFSSGYFHVDMLGNGKLYDMNYRKRPIITGFVTDETKKEVLRKIKDSGLKLKFLCLEQHVDENGVAFPSIRLEWFEGKKEINLLDFLSGKSCNELGITTVTLCSPDDNKTRGIRLSLCEDGTKIYEVAHDSYEMTVNWEVEGKECKIKVLIHSDKPVEFIERNGITEEQLQANTEVILGPQGKAKPLYEALASQLQQESSEEVKLLSEGANKVEDFIAKSPEARFALKELGSQVQQEKYPEKELEQLGGSWGRLLPHMPDPTKWDISEVVDQLGGPSTDLREVKNTLLLKKGLISEKTLNQLG